MLLLGLEDKNKCRVSSDRLTLDICFALFRKKVERMKSNYVLVDSLTAGLNLLSSYTVFQGKNKVFLLSVRLKYMLLLRSANRQ